MQKSEPIECLSRPIPLTVALMAALAVHLPLLLMKLPLQSYDTNFHIFFSSHYVHHWFDPWNTKWFAGFGRAGVSADAGVYWIALLSRVMGLELAYMAVQMAAILLLVVGVYRFSMLWVSPARSFDCGVGECFSRLREFPGLQHEQCQPRWRRRCI